MERTVSSPLIICYVHLLQAGVEAAVEALHLLLFQSFQQTKSISVHTAPLSQDQGSGSVVVTVKRKKKTQQNRGTLSEYKLLKYLHKDEVPPTSQLCSITWQLPTGEGGVLWDTWRQTTMSFHQTAASQGGVTHSGESAIRPLLIFPHSWFNFQIIRTDILIKNRKTTAFQPFHV